MSRATAILSTIVTLILYFSQQSAPAQREFLRIVDAMGKHERLNKAPLSPQTITFLFSALVSLMLIYKASRPRSKLPQVVVPRAVVRNVTNDVTHVIRNTENMHQRMYVHQFVKQIMANALKREVEEEFAHLQQQYKLWEDRSAMMVQEQVTAHLARVRSLENTIGKKNVTYKKLKDEYAEHRARSLGLIRTLNGTIQQGKALSEATYRIYAEKEEKYKKAHVANKIKAEAMVTTLEELKKENQSLKTTANEVEVMLAEEDRRFARMEETLWKVTSERNGLRGNLNNLERKRLNNHKKIINHKKMIDQLLMER